MKVTIAVYSRVLLACLLFTFINGCSPVVPLKATIDETKMGSLKAKSSLIRIGDSRASIIRLMGKPQKSVSDVVNNREYLHYCLFGLVSGEGIGFWIRDEKLAATTYWEPDAFAVQESGESDQDGARFSDEIVWNCYENLYIDWKISPVAVKADSAQTPEKEVEAVIYDEAMKSYEPALAQPQNDSTLCDRATTAFNRDWSERREDETYVRRARDKNLDCISLSTPGVIFFDGRKTAAKGDMFIDTNNDEIWVYQDSPNFERAFENAKNNKTSGFGVGFGNASDCRLYLTKSLRARIDEEFLVFPLAPLKRELTDLDNQDFWFKIDTTSGYGGHCTGFDVSLYANNTVALERWISEAPVGFPNRINEQVLTKPDMEPPSIKLLETDVIDALGILNGIVSDNSGIAEVRIDNELVSFDDSGQFSFSTFIPPGGKKFEITAYDFKGLSTTQTIRLEREGATQVAKISFDRLNPTTRRAKSNSDAIALVVGVAEYEKTAAAEFADRDAQVFYDYANLKLGIPRERIQTLVNDKADVVGLLSGINKWLKRSVRQGESDVYIFFAGHGLASDDGDTAYLIPYDGAPDFLERTAISRDEVFREVSSVNPRSVTVFLDTCYSGDTRGESRLIAGRPLGIKLQEQSLPAGFTVLTAAGGDQIAKPLKEAQHGMFSYFLMKGMEGGADADGNNEITARELHTFVRENVVQQSGGSQVPELQGDGERVLVRFR